MALGVSACDDKPVQPTPVCSYTIDPASRAFSSDAGSGTITVSSSAATCAWTATTGAVWVTIASGTSGTGPGTVSYTVAANATTDARTTTVTAGGQIHTISQQGRPATVCTYTIAPSSASLGNGGGNGSFTVTAPAGCAWTAASNVPWLTITTGAQGTGTGVVSYRADANASTADRTGTIVAGGQSFVLAQSGQPSVQCDYAVTPVTFSPCMDAGTVVARLTTATACTWTVTTTVPWLTATTGASGTGTADIRVAHTENYDAPREGIIQVRWPTPTAGQNLRVAQAGCLYGVSRTSFSFGVAGGSSSFDVVQQSEPIICGGALQDRCRWTATSNVPWITITSSMPRVGDNPVAFTVTANPTGAQRTGTITVRDRIVQITQAAQ
jgi:hypothetical protein